MDTLRHALRPPQTPTAPAQPRERADRARGAWGAEPEEGRGWRARGGLCRGELLAHGYPKACPKAVVLKAAPDAHGAQPRERADRARAAWGAEPEGGRGWPAGESLPGGTSPWIP